MIGIISHFSSLLRGNAYESLLNRLYIFQPSTDWNEEKTFKDYLTLFLIKYLNNKRK